MNRRSPALLLLGLLLTTGPAGATIQNVAVDPATTSVSAGRGITTRLEWEVTTDQGPNDPIQSVEGTFRANGPGGAVLGRVNRVISGNADTIAPFEATIGETLTIPESVMLRAQGTGADRIVYVRTFSDSGGQPSPGDTGSATFALTGGLGGEFEVTRVALRFDDGSVQRVVAPESELEATARITFSGSGRLEGRWEIARPTSTRSEPVFRSIGLVRRQLTGTGREATLRSPALPTRDDGIYLLRLRITSPDSELGPAEIGYAVNAGLAPAPGIATIGGLNPAPGATWRAGTRFRWNALAAAVAYRLEFHADAGAEGEPVSGVLVSAPVSQTELSRVARSHLADGRRYWWRLVAFDPDGNVIGRSPPRPVQMPGGG